MIVINFFDIVGDNTNMKQIEVDSLQITARNELVWFIGEEPHIMRIIGIRSIKARKNGDLIVTVESYEDGIDDEMEVEE